MSRICDIRPSVLLKEVGISHNGRIVEGLVKRRVGGIVTHNLRGQIWCLARCGVLWELDFVDDSVDDLRLGRLDLAVALLLEVDAQVILYVALVLYV